MISLLLFLYQIYVFKESCKKTLRFTSNFAKINIIIFSECYYSNVIWNKNRGDPGIEPGTSCTLNRNHTTRPIARSIHLPKDEQK
jgi:hypothetical protein